MQMKEIDLVARQQEQLDDISDEVVRSPSTLGSVAKVTLEKSPGYDQNI